MLSGMQEPCIKVWFEGKRCGFICVKIIDAGDVVFGPMVCCLLWEILGVLY